MTEAEEAMIRGMLTKGASAHSADDAQGWVNAANIAANTLFTLVELKRLPVPTTGEIIQ